MAAKEKDVSFEEALNELEQIAEKLEKKMQFVNTKKKRKTRSQRKKFCFNANHKNKRMATSSPSCLYPIF